MQRGCAADIRRMTSEVYGFKSCPDCAEDVRAAALICRHCCYEFASWEGFAWLPEAARAGAAALLRLAQDDRARGAHKGPDFDGDPSSGKAGAIPMEPFMFVLGCVADRQVPAERAWNLPRALMSRLGVSTFDELVAKSDAEITDAMLTPSPLHRYKHEMAKGIVSAVRRIEREWGGDAARNWNDNAPANVVIGRFRAFDGVGQKISTMAVNILDREFNDVSFSDEDRRSIDESTDVHVCRVMYRFGLTSDPTDRDEAMLVAIMLNPEHPGLIDPTLRRLGSTVCTASNPACPDCPLSDSCVKSGLASPQRRAS